MIQRKQTIYLFFAGLIPLVLLFIPLGHLSSEVAYYEYTAFAVREATPDATFIVSTIGNAVLLIATAVLSLVSIFLYKNRKAQMKLVSLNMVLILLVICAIMYFYPKFIFPKHLALDGVVIKYNYMIIISFVSAIGLYLAKKAIAKDEAMIRSADRLR